MDADDPVWLLGFRGVPLTWSICGAPVVVNTHGAAGRFCSDCVSRVGVTSLMTDAAL